MVSVRVSGIGFGSAYLTNELKVVLSQPQQHAIYELGNNYSNRHIIAGLSAFDTPKRVKHVLLRVHDIVSSKELAKVFLPTNFSPDKLRRYPAYVFHA